MSRTPLYFHPGYWDPCGFSSAAKEKTYSLYLSKVVQLTFY